MVEIYRNLEKSANIMRSLKWNMDSVPREGIGRTCMSRKRPILHCKKLSSSSKRRCDVEGESRYLMMLQFVVW